MSNIQIITNANGSGDWVIIKHNGTEIYSGHRPNTQDIVDILSSIGHEVARLDLNDEQIAMGSY